MHRFYGKRSRNVADVPISRKDAENREEKIGNLARKIRMNKFLQEAPPRRCARPRLSRRRFDSVLKTDATLYEEARVEFLRLPNDADKASEEASKN